MKITKMLFFAALGLWSPLCWGQSGPPRVSGNLRSEELQLEKRNGQEEINGHEYVDLGLSVKWAACNIGADNPSDFGNYFAWGETQPKSEYSVKSSVTWDKDLGDNAGDAQYDAAKANWGGTWRMPTLKEMQELSKCTWTWTTRDGHTGYEVTGPNGRSIFLPASGWRFGSSLAYEGISGVYWSVTPHAYSRSVYGIVFHRNERRVYWRFRYYGASIRPVSD